MPRGGMKTLDQRSVEAARRLNGVTALGAGLISALTLVAVWPDRAYVLAVVVVQTVLIALNTWITAVALQRWPLTRCETGRAVANLTGALLLGQLTHWPAPIWMWLVYVAAAFEHFRPRLPTVLITVFGVVEGAAAIHAGVRWIIPLTVVPIALFFSEVSRLRFDALRAMIREADAQRLALEQAHASLREVNARLEREMVAREHAEVELRQAHKLEAVGRLASGIAHEINTPVQFVSDSIHFIKEAVDDVSGLMAAYRELRDAVAGGAPAAHLAARVEALEHAADLEYLRAHVPAAIERSLDGVGRVATIVRSLKEFAHPDRHEMAPADLNRAIESTLVIAANSCRNVADVEADLGAIPRVCCYVGGINQVVLNIVVNAVHAIEDARGPTGERGRIRVATRAEGDAVVIAISDTGGGIPEAIRDRIFEPFFTTKEVGRGTGQGLALARSVVCDLHGGQLTFETEVGRGTTFFVRVPARPSARAAVATAA